MTTSLVRLCAAADVPPNSVIAVDLGDKTLAVYNLDGTFYVTDDECTHGAASLSEGQIDGDLIECSLHFGAFRIATGEPVLAPCSIPLRTYRVVLREGAVLVDLDRSAGEAG